jgi:glutathione synthase
MHFLLMIDPIESLKEKKDSSIVMMRAASAAGHRVSVAQVSSLIVQNTKVMAEVTELTIHPVGEAWYEVRTSAWLPLAAFDAVIMRKDPPFDLHYMYATQLLSLAQSQGAKVFNHPAALRDWNEKLAILHYPTLTVPIEVTQDAAKLEAFIDRHGDVILKPLDGMGGAGIFRVRADDVNRHGIVETMTHAAYPIMAQVYIPAITQGDKRILVIDGEPLPYCVARIPKSGETRANLAAGGRAQVQPLSDRDRMIALTVAPELKARGILLAGLDVIGDYLTEINITSPTCFREIIDQTDCPAGEYWLAALMKHLKG